MPRRIDEPIEYDEPRVRRTKREIDEYRDAVYQLVEANRPCTVRQVYYLGIGRLWDKDQGSERKAYLELVRNIGVMREDGLLPWGWIKDGTRMRQIPSMHETLSDALDEWHENYRRDFWSTQPAHVEVWAESDSVAGIVAGITQNYGVGLFPCRGQSSKTFAQEATLEYRELGKPVTVLYVGDWDPTGLAIPNSLDERLRRYSNDHDIELERVALTVDDVLSGELVSHGVNRADTNYRRYSEICQQYGIDPSISWEVEALAPGLLRERLDHALQGRIVDVDAWAAMARYERAERAQLANFKRYGLGE